VDGDVSSRIAALDPLRELAAADRFRLEKRAKAIVDVPKCVIGHQSPQFLVIGIGQFVVNHFGEDVIFLGQSDQVIELLKCENGRFLDQHMLPGTQSRFCRLEMPVVGRGDTDHIDTRGQEIFDRFGTGKIFKGAQS